METSATSASTAPAIILDRIPSETIIVPIIGTSPLVVHRFSEKAKREMLDRMQGRKKPKESRNPEEDFRLASYRLGKDGYGFPAIGLKAATVSAARFYPRGSVTMTGLRQFMFFHGEMGEDNIGLCRIENPVSSSPWPRMREDVVKLATNVSDLRYRPEFWPWSMKLKITYVSSALSRDSVLSLIDAGGLGVGIGEWRPERGGDLGTYRIDVDKEVEIVT